MRFLLRANPAETVRRAGTKRGVRVDAVMNAKRPRSERGDRSFDAEDEQSAALRWLFKRADRFGVRFEEPACRVDAYRVERLSRGFHRREDDTRFAVVDYQGELEVTSPERLSEALRGGIGKAKAYGCGLLLVRPA
jgi:CRISPR system Cascade subunit CasE